MYPVFHIGPFQVSAYLGCLVIAFLVSTLTLLRENAHAPNHLRLDIMLLPILLFSALFGARVMFIMLERPSSSWRACFMLWYGGYYYYGGVAGGTIAYLIYLHAKRNPILPGLDRAAPFLALGESIARIGCFCSGCCWGKPAHHRFAVCYGYESPAFYQQYTHGLVRPYATQTLPVHPTPIYMSLSLFGVFVLLWLIARRGRYREGSIILAFFCIHSIVRFTVDFFRGDLAHVLWGFTVTQLIALAVFITAFTLLAIRHVHEQRHILALSPPASSCIEDSLLVKQ